MARRRVNDDEDVSLFPFLSIIASVIGVLTLMIAAVTLGQMNQDDVKDAVANAQAMEQVQTELAQMEADLQRLKLAMDEEQADVLRRAAERDTELVKSRAELEELVKALAAARKKSLEMADIKIVIPEIPKGERETVGDMQDQLRVVRERLALLTKEMERRQGPAEEAQVSVVPGGTGISFKPEFVECAADAIVIHAEEPPVRVRLAEVAANKPFVALLQRVANDRSRSIVFVVRADGLRTYRTVKAICDQQDVRNGKLPAIGNGRLDFSQFRDGAGKGKRD